jgi:hypothetical protein
VSTNGHDFAPVTGKIPGTMINLGGREYILAPLNLDQVQQFEEVIPKLGQAATLQENIKQSLPLIHASLSRNYPEITIEDVRKIVDLGNFAAASWAIVSLSGYKRVPAGESPPASA